MNADLFYETYSETAVSLYLISKSQWEEAIEPLSSFELNCFNTQQFKGKLGDCCLINHPNGTLHKAYIGVGEGTAEQALAHAALTLPPGSYQVTSILSHNAALHWALAQYKFDAYKHKTVKPRLLVVKSEDLKDILPLAQAIFLVRDLINTPANAMGPKDLALVLEHVAKTFEGQFQQWVGDDLLKHNFPAVHAVGRASTSAPRMLSLSYGDASHPRITLIGKGVCFDSGGLDIKLNSTMRLMKKDMGGAAHVIGLAQWIMAKRLPVRLEVLIPAVENALGPNAFRPGDVLTMRNGLTVEIDNTDAEGRLILADALSKACEDSPELIIDFSTLTGAARIAVGTDIAALFTNSDALAADLMDASQKTQDAVWRLPLFAAYKDQLKSYIADMTNCGTTSYGGAIVAALFLQQFISKSIPWVHFDVMAWNLSSKPGKPEGGEALGFRTVAEYLLRRYG